MLNRLQGVFASLEENDVKYLVIGGIAAVLHGVPRATFDLDLLIEATPENAERLLGALEAAGLATATLTSASDVLDNEITVFQDRVRIDVQTRTPGIRFEDAWANREEMSYQDQKFYVVSRQDLIEAKKAAGRQIDLEDVQILEFKDDG